MTQEVALFWFRRDLRLNDNAGLYHALKSGCTVIPLFIFDTNIIDGLPQDDARIGFIHQSLEELHHGLKKANSCGLLVKKGEPIEIFKALIQKYGVSAIYTNHDFETYAKKRDEEVAALIEENGGSFHHFKDHVIFDGDEVLKDNGKPYTVFTPYSRKWKGKLSEFYVRSYPITELLNGMWSQIPAFPSLEEIGFKPSSVAIPGSQVSDDLISTYHQTRDIPSINGTSRLGVHLRFGTISIRKLVRKAIQLNDAFLNELVWRDFYAMILYHFPKVETRAFKPAYDRIAWRNSELDFQRWCDGKTGYPIVDAGMRELNQTGFMHNRVRMIVASFLTKHLLIDWRWGESYFAQKLLDFDLASNNGGWQWASGSGCDAAPYFRVFNPELQTRKFDPALVYVKKWVPEFQSFNYPEPMVEHRAARLRALDFYAGALKD